MLICGVSPVQGGGGQPSWLGLEIGDWLMQQSKDKCVEAAEREKETEQSTKKL